VFAVAYPETRGKLNSSISRVKSVLNLTFAGKSLEEIDEIFGDVQIIREEDAKLDMKKPMSSQIERVRSEGQ
jgi:hypothetical protein